MKTNFVFIFIRVCLGMALVLGVFTVQGANAEETLPAPFGAGQQAEFQPGELLVKLKSDIATASTESVLSRYGATFIRSLYDSPVALWRVPEGQELALVEQLNADPVVEYAEPNYKVRIFLTPNDPSFSKQWAHNIMQSANGWNIATGRSTVTIAVIDSGIDPNHPDLASKVVPGYDFANGDADPRDDNGHGTHVAGIAAAATNNGTGVAGVSWQARIMPVKVTDDEGSGTVAMVTDGITYAYQHGAKVLNLSLGGPGYSMTQQNAVNAAHAASALVVAAMGNDNISLPFYPAAYNNVVAVSATNNADTKSYYSNYGFHVDLAAPGGAMSIYGDTGGIYSTMPTYPVNLTTEYDYKLNYDYLQGTSQASPYTAGLAALIWSMDLSMTPDQVRLAMQNSANDLGSPGWDQYYGYGRINVQRAVEAVASTLPVSNLRMTQAITETASVTVTLRWTKPVNATGIAIRYSKNPINESNWGSATALTSLPGTAETYTGKVPYTSGALYFALKFQRSDTTWSKLSNNAFYPTRNLFTPYVQRR